MTKVNLSQKERMLLEDQKSHEKICIEKYTNYANQAEDPELKQLLQTYAQEEQQHYDTITQILSGTIPAMNQQSQQKSNHSQQSGQSQQSNMQGTGNAGLYNSNDASLCSDLLMTEKYISGAYDTTIFECVSPELRSALNHIQKEEQQHGEGIFNYMQSKGMYNVK